MNKFFKFIAKYILPFDNNIMTQQKVYERIAEEYSCFKKYNILKGQVYLIMLGLFSEEINNYLFEHKKMINDYFPVEMGDYIKILGIITPQEKKFMLLIVYKDDFDKKVGNFLSVERWPPFQNYEKKIEDSHWEIYNEFKTRFNG